ncbi:immediate early response gene 2 protein [Emydura macquarii macquarii]|uniref:immediate early response gene 2 protein n=1 Tax=Emydura macquarii macquarii TaxID=1129001 RepID=UPI00352B7AAD
MEVQKEAQRIMTMSVWKMYHSRLQRGGLRLHHSLQLSLVMRSARELYLSAKLEEEEEEEGGGAGALRREQQEVAGAAPGQLQGALAAPGPPPPAEERTPAAAPGDPEPMETQEASGVSPPPPAPAPRVPAGKASRKRRSSSLDKPGAAEAGLVPTKKARLEEEEAAAAGGPPQPQGQEGRFPSLAKVLQSRFSGVLLSGPPKGPDPTPGCRPGDGVLSILVRAVVAF